MKDSQHLQWVRNRLAMIDQVDNRIDYIMRLNRIIERIAIDENKLELVPLLICMA